jgi:hypothetical protein
LTAVTLRFDPAFGSTLEPRLANGSKLVLSGRPLPASVVGASPTIALTAERHTDLALIDFTFYGFAVDRISTPPALEVIAKESANTWIGVVAQLPPQAIGEANYIYPQTQSPLSFDPTPVLSQVAGPSRIAFNFEPGDRIPLPTMTVADLLDWSNWNINVQPQAVVGSGSTTVGPPGQFDTAVEAPLSVYLAPVTSSAGPAFAQFNNRTEPLFVNEVSDCWTTTLGGSGGLVSAVWSPDFGYDSATSLGSLPETGILYGIYSSGPPAPRAGR